MALDDIFESIGKTYKDAGKPFDLDNPEEYSKIEFRKSGCLAFDWIVGNHSTKGGLPRGKIVEIMGPEGGGKTTLCSVIAAATQKYKKQKDVLYVDFEAKYNVEYGIELGIQKEHLALWCPDGSRRGEAGCQALIDAVAHNKCGLAVCDSFSAIISKEELAGELGDSNIGRRAMLQSRMINKILGNNSPSSATTLIVNQLRDVIGNAYGPSEQSTGARALKFAAIARVDVRGGQKIEEDGAIIGMTVKLKAAKNQASRPFLKEEIDVYFGIGYDNTKWCINKASEIGVILKQKKKRFVYNALDGYRNLLPEEDYTLDQLTEEFQVPKSLDLLYAACVEVNNRKIEEQCAERRLKRERVLDVAAKESIEPDL